MTSEESAELKKRPRDPPEKPKKVEGTTDPNRAADPSNLPHRTKAEWEEPDA